MPGVTFLTKSSLRDITPFHGLFDGFPPTGMVMTEHP
jgi:hypothetical protein